ncbi:LacI family DNA-binding transcriptional regulator [Rhizomicrobium electricum]|jgi:LacI family transcriptional regulator|uniref:LacI family DNA-binding transcriptional regulator n=1 Tax=Rhizomicrobium electricum TaxID=480070 RepID=A0ABN1F3U8_9PROT|nr:LacI family DNA-binding transcriptional regulator [Rhizomicrobium electricum]NIJ49256.1 LacI family transcriptional regulator [Rhizomicrobium electricum]
MKKQVSEGRSPTIVDIAREAGVAFKTVARVVNGDGAVKQETRERVEAVIARLGYKRNVWARSLRSARSHLIAMAIMPTASPDAENFELTSEENLAVSSYFNRLQMTAMARSQEAGYHLFVDVQRSGAAGVAKHIVDMVEHANVDGVLLVPPLSDDLSVMKALRKKGVPFVRVSPYQHLEMSSYVYIDDRQASYELTRHFIKLGHRDIAFFKGAPDHLSSTARFAGFEDAMREGGIAIRPEWVVDRVYSMRFGGRAGDLLLAQPRRPTAVICFNDDVAAGVMTAAYRMGLELPRDLSIAGFDDSPIAAAMWPALTSVYQPVGTLASAAAEMLIHEIEHGAEHVARKLEYRLVLRDSTAPIR